MRETAKIFMRMKSGTTDTVYGANSYLFLPHLNTGFTTISSPRTGNF